MIDTLRQQLQECLDQLLAEAEKLRKALSALDPRGQQSPARRAQPRASSTAARTRARPSGSSRRRTPPGATKARVLDVLSDGNAMTAGEIAAATGLGQGTVSTTLTRLAKSGEVRKAQRGYALPEARTAGATTEGS